MKSDPKDNPFLQFLKNEDEFAKPVNLENIASDRLRYFMLKNPDSRIEYTNETIIELVDYYKKSEKIKNPEYTMDIVIIKYDIRLGESLSAYFK